MIPELRPNARCDFHMHSTRSDGRFPAEDVLSRAAAAGLQWIALTDHDLPPPFLPGAHTIGERTIHVLAGAEITTTVADAEEHLLVYFPRAIPEDFQAFCADQCRLRARRWDDTVTALGAPELGAAGELAWSGERAVTRYHLAQALVAAGRTRSVRESFDRFLSDARALVPRPFLPMEDAIRRARAAGGLPVWAHPMKARAERHLPAMVAAGLAGVEGLRPAHNSAERQGWRKLARRYGLFVTGGSDWHGWTDGELGMWAVERQDVEAFCAALAA